MNWVRRTPRETFLRHFVQNLEQTAEIGSFLNMIRPTSHQNVLQEKTRKPTLESVAHNEDFLKSSSTATTSLPGPNTHKVLKYTKTFYSHYDIIVLGLRATMILLF